MKNERQNDQLTLKDVLPDPNDMETEVVERLNDLWVLGLVDKLTPLQKDILMQRYGFVTSEPMTTEAIRRTTGLTYRRIMKVERQAIATIRRSIWSAGSYLR